MKTLYIQCNMGVAGDMLSAALIGLFPEKESVLAELNALNIPGVEYRLSESEKCGIKGLHMDVLVEGHMEGEHSGDHDHDHHDHDHHEHDHHDHEHHDHHDHDHDHHDHDHHDHEHHDHDHHDHHHRSMQDIEHIVHDIGLPAKVETDVKEVYKRIAEAESQVHGVPVSEIHFHEVGTMDAIADIVSVCFIMDKLGADEVISSPVNTGSGNVKCAHGILPVPAPATAHLLKGIPFYNDGIKGELTTPTGAALLGYFVNRYGDMPVMEVSSVGYGMGTKDFERANAVRVFWGESTGASQDEVFELSCNVDDMTAEEIGFATEELMKGGALDVYTMPIGMKKNRPGTLIRVMCEEAGKEALIGLIFKHTSTLGVRETRMKRYVLNRAVDSVETEYGTVHFKRSEGYGVAGIKPEYEDLAAIARANNMSLAEVRDHCSRILH